MLHSFSRSFLLSSRRCLTSRSSYGSKGLHTNTKEREDIDLAHLSVFDMFAIGIGPSSSHTVGPMKAAQNYTHRLKEKKILESTKRIKADVYGSLALTGIGHGTPKAILMGLENELPHSIDPVDINSRVINIRHKNVLNLGGEKKIEFSNDDLVLHKDKVLPFHSNGMIFSAYDENGEKLDSYEYYSIGGGFIIDEDAKSGDNVPHSSKHPVYEYHTTKQLLHICKEHELTIAEVQMANEIAYGRTRDEVVKDLLTIWGVMNDTIERGMHSKELILPGGLNVRRRAPKLFSMLESKGKGRHDLLRKNVKQYAMEPGGEILDWMTLYAMAVNEENAAGGRVVTAPTNGAAGVIPAVFRYFLKWAAPDSDHTASTVDFLLTAASVGMLFKKGASISAAEVGCQGEIGVACSMAAGALCALYGGSPIQVSVAAEIGMEHHLGMTCDPIGGLVQVPCIERNSMGSIKAVTAARLAVNDDEGSMVVSLDDVIETMLKTGREMASTYKETSQGGLAIQIPSAVVEC